MGNSQGAAKHYKVSLKTISRWMKHYELKSNYRPNKLKGRAEEIRALHEKGRSIKDLAAQYQVTFSAISRLLHKITHKPPKEFADVYVIYNVT